MRTIAWRYIVFGSVALLFGGLLTDLSPGLPILRSTASWSTRIFAVVVIGALALLAEAGVERLNRQDAVSDPLSRRAWHLLLLLTLVAAVIVVMMALVGWLLRN